MTPLHIIVDGDGAWPDLVDNRFGRGMLTAVAALHGGTVNGAPSVALRVDLPDGSVVLAQTTLSLFLAAADAFKARHGDPRLRHS